MSLNIVNSFKTIPTIFGTWIELGRTTLGGNADSISVSGLPDKRYYMVLVDIIPSGEVTSDFRINNDSATNYSRRKSFNGLTDETGVNLTSFDNGGFTGDLFTINYLSNLSVKEKLALTWFNSQISTGAGTAPTRLESVSKWVNTVDAINRIDSINNQTGDYLNGSEVVVLGWDPADIHTDNFWEELASVNASGSPSSLSTGTFALRKYLWVQIYSKTQAPGASFHIRVGNNTIDTAANYAFRENTDGGADSTATNVTFWLMNRGGDNEEKVFSNMFIVNVANKEKLAIKHNTQFITAGPGTAPNRTETIDKWTNTSNQINIIEIVRTGGTGTLADDSIIKVWGHD